MLLVTRLTIHLDYCDLQYGTLLHLYLDIEVTALQLLIWSICAVSM